MWTATILSASVADAGHLSVSIRLTSDSGLPPHDVSVQGRDLKAIRSAVRARVAALERAEQLRLIVPADGSTFVIDDSPTPAEQDRAAFLLDLERLRHLRAAVALGILTGTEASVTNTTTTVRNALVANPSYLELI